MFFFAGCEQHRTRASSRRTPASRRGRHSHTPHNYPHALPCGNYYEQFPEEAGPMGNVEVCSRAELQEWLLVARPVSPEEAEHHGGCIKYVPDNTTKKGDDVQPMYFCITDPDDAVYGRAHYIHVATPTEKVAVAKSVRAASCDFLDGTGEDALTNSDLTSCRSNERSLGRC